VANHPPALTGGSVAKYPLTRRRKLRTAVATFLDFSEQRYAKGVGLAEFDLTFHKIPTVDKDRWRDFFIARRGAFDITWEITIEDPPGSTTTYSHLQFAPGQQFEAVEEATGLWSFRLRVRQNRSD